VKFFDDIHQLAQDAAAIRRILMSTTTPPVLQPLVDALNTLQATVAATNDIATKIDADVDALLAKIATGGNITAADVQPLVDHVNAMNTALAASVTAETAEDQKVNPPPPPPASAP
jgi:hypothetical protein